jgi:hypothetical protein
MDENEFWALVDAGVEDPNVVEERVKGMSEQELVDFYWLYQDQIDELMEDEFTEVFEDYSEGHHEDLATWVVRQGKAYFDSVVAEPETFPTELPKSTGPSYQTLVTREYKPRYGKLIRAQDDPPPADA